MDNAEKTLERGSAEIAFSREVNLIMTRSTIPTYGSIIVCDIDNR